MIHLMLAATAASTAASSSNASVHVGTDYPVAILTVVVLVYLGYLIVNRVARGDSYVNLRKVLLASLILHLVCAPLQILVVKHFYGGVADWLRYSHQGALLADNWRNLQFTTQGTGIGGIVGNGATSIYGGVIMTVVGPNLLASFLVAAFTAFVGSVIFYLAFRITFPEANRKRYAWLVLLFPSLLFWTADVSKEASMLLALSLVAYGIALILQGRAFGYPIAILGGAFALLIRPDELVILVVAFALAMVVRGLFRQGRSFRNPIRIFAAVVVVGGFVVVTGISASHFLHQAGGNGLTGTLNQIGVNNQGVGAGFGSSQVSYSSNPLYYPRDIYTVLFDPLPITARSLTQLAAAAENVLILVVIFLSLRQLRCLFRVSVQRPYVLVCAVYSLVFVYAFAALGNLGLITRERTLLLPFLFVLPAIPLAPEGEYPYPWQLARRLRRPVTEPGRATPARPGDEVEWVVGEDVAAQWGADPVDESEAADWSPAEWIPDR
jgi:hypothetical protein